MDVLERYLDAVKLWLPRRQAKDIAAEVEADIRAEIEGQEEAHDRHLTREEVEAILTRWGHPMLVASRYQPQESLIGAPFYPTYFFVLKLLLFVHVIPWFVAWIVLSIAQPSWLAGPADFASLQSLVTRTVWMFALVTAGFAIADRIARRTRTLETWHARQLTPPARRRDWREISRAGAAFELAIGLAIASWWSRWVAAPATVDLDGIARVTWMPFEPLFYWIILAMMFAGIVMSAINLFSPRWTSRRLAAQIGLDAIGVVLVALMLPTSLIEVTAADRADVVQVARWINLSWRIALVVVGAGLATRLIVGLSRVKRVDAVVPATAA